MPPTLARRNLLAGLGAAAALPARAQDAAPAAPPPAPAPVPAAPPAPTIAQALAAYVDGVTYASLQPDTVEMVKSHLIDALGCAMGAFNEPVVRSVRTVALDGAEGGPATVLGTTRRTGTDWACFANGAAMRYLDLNDAYAGREVGHPSDNITPCLAVAEAQGATGRDLIAAILLAYEVDCRLLDTVQISARGWDHPNFSLPAAALAAGRLMRLPVGQLTEAVNLSLAGHLAVNQTRLQVISNWKGLADAEAGRAGVIAARLARAGITGPAPAFEGKAGFFADVSGPFALDTGQFGGRGGAFRIAQCSYKLFPAQVLLQTAIQAAATLAPRAGDPARVRSILVHTTRAGLQYSADSRDKWAPQTGETADHSLPYIVARTLLDREITSTSYSPQALHDPRLLALLARLEVAEDPALTAMYPQRLPTRVSLTLEDGSVVSEQVDDLPGSGGRPMTREAVEAKVRRYTRALWPEAQLRAFLDVAWSLEEQGDLGELLRHMVVAA